MLPNSDEIGAKFIVEKPADDEFILSMQRFKGMTKWTACSAGGNTITIAFNDKPTFEYAKETWDWVNGPNNHSFVMVAEPGDCARNKHRLPFIVKNITYDEAGNVAYLQTELSDWYTAAPIHELVFGYVPEHKHPQPEPHQIEHAKRGVRRVIAGAAQHRVVKGFGHILQRRGWFKDHIHKVTDALGITEEVDHLYHKVKSKFKPLAAKLLYLAGKFLPEVASHHISLSWIKINRLNMRFGPTQLWFRLVLLNFKSHGSLDWGIHVATDGRRKAYVSANKIWMEAQPTLSIGSTIGKDKDDGVFARLPIIPPVSTSDIILPGIANIGPTYEVFAKLGLGTVDFIGELYFPFNATIPEDAILELDLSGSEDDIVHVESWLPHFQFTTTPSITGRVCADIKACIHMRLDLKIAFDKTGKADLFEAGFAVGPYILERFQAAISTAHGCSKKNTPNKLFLVDVATYAGIEARAEIKIVESRITDWVLSVSKHQSLNPRLCVQILIAAFSRGSRSLVGFAFSLAPIILVIDPQKMKTSLKKRSAVGCIGSIRRKLAVQGFMVIEQEPGAGSLVAI